MNVKKLLAFALALTLIVCSFCSCDASVPGKKNNDELEKTPDSLTLVDNNDLNGQEVTAITAATDKNGKVTDSTGITDVSGHKVYSTGQKDSAGRVIYTTGKKGTTGEILYTLNEKDTFGNQIYYTGNYNDKGVLVIKPTNEAPDYSSNDVPDNKVILGTTTTTTTVSIKDNSKVVITDSKCVRTNYFGGSGLDTFAAIDDCKNGGFVAAGNSTSKDGDHQGASKEWSGTQATVVKYGADKSSVEWKYILGGDGNIFIYDVAELKDESVVAVGCTFASDTDAPVNSKGFSAIIIRIKKNGELMWMYSFPGGENSDGEYLSSVAATPDGGFVAGGKANSTEGFFNGTSEKGSKGFIFKFDKNCNIKWRKILTGSKSNNFSAIDVNSDGDIFATCVTTSTDGDFSGIKYSLATSTNTVLIKLNKKGDLQWARYLESTGNSEYNAVAATDDGGCIVGGSYKVYKKADGIYSMTYGGTDGFVIRYNSNGEVGWAQLIGGSRDDRINGIVQVDGGFAVVGSTSSSDMSFQGYKLGGEEDGFIVYLNGNGERAATVILNGAKSDNVTDVCKLSDGTIAICGQTTSTDGAFAGSGAKQFKSFTSCYEAVSEKK